MFTGVIEGVGPRQALHLFNQNAGRIGISTLTRAELLHGAEESSQPAANLSVVEDFCSRLEVLPTSPRRPSPAA